MYDVGVLIREAQYKTFRDFYDAGDLSIGFVSCFDLRKSWYHPQIKVPAGERAAKWALVTQYDTLQGRDAEQYWLPPSIKEAQRVEGTIRLTMSTQITTHDDSDGKLLGFAIAGNDRRFYPADVQWYTDSVDDRNRPDFESAGMKPFSYERKGKTAALKSYYEAPPELPDDANDLAVWAGKAFDAALASAKPKR